MTATFAKTKERTPNTECSFCGNGLFRLPSQLNLYSTSYCNPVCAGKGKNNIANANKKKPTSITYHCKICGDPFQMIQSDVEKIKKGEKPCRRRGYCCGKPKCETEYKKRKKISRYESRLCLNEQWRYSIEAAKNNNWKNSKKRDAKIPFKLRNALGPMGCGIKDCRSG